MIIQTKTKLVARETTLQHTFVKEIYTSPTDNKYKYLTESLFSQNQYLSMKVMWRTVLTNQII